MFVGGWRTLEAIDNGIFEKNKEYKFVKGLIVDVINDEKGKEMASFVYDLGALFTSAKSLKGNVETTFVLSGSELNKIVYGYASGLDAVSIVIGTEQLMIKFK